MSERIRQAGLVAWAVVGLFALLALVGLVFWTVRVVFPPLVLAGAIVFILNPVVTRLQRHRVPRAGGTAIAYLSVIGIVVLAGFLIAPLIQRQADELAEEWPAIRADLEESWNDLAARSTDNDWIVEIPTVDEIEDQLGGGTDDAFTEEFDDVVRRSSDQLQGANEDELAREFDRVVAEMRSELPEDVSTEEFDDVVTSVVQTLRAEEGTVLAADLDRVAADARERFPEQTGLADQLETVREIGTRIFEVGLIFVLAPIIAFYMLVDLPHIRRVAEGLVPDRARDEVMVVAHRLNNAIGGFFRGQLAVAIIVGIMVSIGLAILGLPFWLIVGMIAGAFNLIPLIGPWVGAVPGIVIAFTTGGGLGTAIWVAVIMTVAQQIDNHFISPLVMQRTVNLHPAVVMLALLAGGTLGGFFGLLLAVPTVAVLKIIIGHLWRTYVLGQPLDELAEFEAREDTKPAVGFIDRIGDEDTDVLPDGTSIDDDDRGEPEVADEPALSPANE